MNPGTTPAGIESEADLRAAFESADYVAGDEIVTTVSLAITLEKPLLVEGPPGAGKTEIAKVLASALGTELVRLQCYEGLTAENALYEWNYTKQLLAVQTRASGGEGGSAEAESVFSEEYLLERPLLRALRAGAEAPPVLLIDEVDRADEAFEALLLEVLSDFQVSVPEIGTVRADVPPVVVITSNRTRGLSDALKRRCLYLYIEPPDYEKERTIVERKVPELEAALVDDVVGFVQGLRGSSLRKQPGISETLDWARAIATHHTDGDDLSVQEVKRTLACLLKEAEDVERVDEELIADLLDDPPAPAADEAATPGDTPDDG
ncbi:AAA family ATPase [Halobacterium wangiae]|uniref:AAA family ATPase n=1 Tax=Halobacterium wangiae TaxID=2902623 RepID=UPI001E57D48D|nr:MoxR family ATPase [Halobacterium wangiae]